MNRYNASWAAMLIAVVVSSRCNAQYAAPASIAPSLIQYLAPQPGQPGYFVSRLVLYNPDQTWVGINSKATSPTGSVLTTFATGSGTYNYSIDPSNSSHAIVTYAGGGNENLYFNGVNYGTQTNPIPPTLSLTGPPVFWWSPMQATNGGVNVSNRCQLSSGAVAISGFVVQSIGLGVPSPEVFPLLNGQAIQSTGPRWVLIRAVGATLTNFGVSGVVSNPSFTLYDSDQIVRGTSSVWSSDPNLLLGYSTIFALSGAFPLNSGSDEGVLLIQLPPGAYTAIFKAGSAGTILCEVYILPF